MTIRRPLRPWRVLAAAAAIGAAAVAAPAHAAETPFTANAATQETITPVPPGLCPANLAGVTVGTGTSSAMAKVSVVAADCFTPVSASQFAFTNGRMTLAGGLGEQIFIEYAGLLTVGAPATLQGTYKVVGGTGRFWGASGSGVLGGTLDMTTLRGNMSLSGTLRTH